MADTTKRCECLKVRLTEDEYETIAYLADFYDISMSDIVRLGLKNMYERHADGRDIRYL
jgi:sulfur relay (sulfurtransferase) DsrC/TusE family protein